jgi:hypothetical protein
MHDMFPFRSSQANMCAVLSELGHSVNEIRTLTGETVLKGTSLKIRGL